MLIQGLAFHNPDPSVEERHYNNVDIILPSKRETVAYRVLT